MPVTRVRLLTPVALCLAIALAAAGCANAPAPSPASPATGTAPPTGGYVQTQVGGPVVPNTPTLPLRVETVSGGFDKPWDLAFLPGGQLLVTERPGRLTLLSGVVPGATARPVQADLRDVYVRGEGGLMGLATYPDFPVSRLFVTCQTHQENGRPVDVRLVTWRLSPDGANARKVRDPLVGGMPVNPSGRHSGCRPTFAPDGALLVGTGDTATLPTIPQDRRSLGGKVLRVDPTTGGPFPGNPFASSSDPRERLLQSFGHRNVQAVAIRPISGQAWSVEHGPVAEDEVNVLVPGANYGWDPSMGGANTSSYDESVPMTDRRRFPDALPGAWNTGDRVEATSGGDFLAGPQWGGEIGTLAVTALRGQKLIFMRPGVGPELDRVLTTAVPRELDNTVGRLRGARLGPDGALYLTTDNGGSDVVLRVTPA